MRFPAKLNAMSGDSWRTGSPGRGFSTALSYDAHGHAGHKRPATPVACRRPVRVNDYGSDCQLMGSLRGSLLCKGHHPRCDIHMRALGGRIMRVMHMFGALPRSFGTSTLMSFISCLIAFSLSFSSVAPANILFPFHLPLPTNLGIITTTTNICVFAWFARPRDKRAGFRVPPLGFGAEAGVTFPSLICTSSLPFYCRVQHNRHNICCL